MLLSMKIKIKDYTSIQKFQKLIQFLLRCTTPKLEIDIIIKYTVVYISFNNLLNGNLNTIIECTNSF